MISPSIFVCFSNAFAIVERAFETSSDCGVSGGVDPGNVPGEVPGLDPGVATSFCASDMNQ
eukprot:6932052-Heterocapsa_arctica.AAC.1